MRQQSHRRSATKPASSGSWRKAVTSLTKVAPASTAASATVSFAVSTLICTPAPAQRADDRDDAAQLLVDRHRLGPRTGRLAADVEDVGTLGDEHARVFDGAIEREPLTAVGERVGRDVEDAHDARGHRALIVGPQALNRPSGAPMTGLMASTGTWLCPTELDRTRLLDMEARIARPRAMMYGALAAGLGSAIPWVGWWPMIPLILQLAIYAAVRPLIAKSARPEYVVAATVVSSQMLLGAGIALSGGPRSPGIALMLLPLVTLPARFSARGVWTGLALAVVRAARRRPSAVDPAGFAANPTYATVGLCAAVGPDRLRPVPEEQRDAPALARPSSTRSPDCSTARRSRRASRRSPSRRRRPASRCACSSATSTASRRSTTATATSAATPCSRTPRTSCASSCARSS